MSAWAGEADLVEGVTSRDPAVAAKVVAVAVVAAKVVAAEVVAVVAVVVEERAAEGAERNWTPAWIASTNA